MEHVFTMSTQAFLSSALAKQTSTVMGDTAQQAAKRKGREELRHAKKQRVDRIYLSLDYDLLSSDICDPSLVIQRSPSWKIPSHHLSERKIISPIDDMDPVLDETPDCLLDDSCPNNVASLLDNTPPCSPSGAKPKNCNEEKTIISDKVEGSTLHQILSLLNDVNQEPPKEWTMHYKHLLSLLTKANLKDEKQKALFNLLNEEITPQTLARIAGKYDGGWLNDTAISLYLTLLQMREFHLRRTLGDKHEHCYFFGTRHCATLELSGRARVIRWLKNKKADLSNCRRLLFIFSEGLHFCAVVADLKNMEVAHYDPLYPNKSSHFRVVRDFLDGLNAAKIINTKGNWTRGDPFTYTKQCDGCSCGVFSCLYANMLSLGKIPRDLKSTVSVPHYREHLGAIIACLHHGLLLKPADAAAG